MTKMLWYAVNGTGQGCIFTSKPERDTHFMRWVGDMAPAYSMVVCLFESSGFVLPALKWADEPVVLSLELNVSE